MKRNGFTLIELLVAIGIIGLLIALLLPALAGMRQSARETVSLANVRTVGTTFAQYAAQYTTYPYRSRGEPLESHPVPVPPGILMVQWWPEGMIVGVSEHWAQAWLWPGIVSKFAEWPENYRTWISPGRPNELPRGPFDDGIDPDDRVSVVYSNSFVARPDLFRAGAAASDSLLGATRPDEVTFPSQKTMLWDRHLAYRVKEPEQQGGHYRAPTPMAFADLHAEVKDPTRASPGVANVMRGGAVQTLHGTEDGVRGRDY